MKRKIDPQILVNEFLDAYDHHDDSKLQSLRRKYGISGASVLAGLFNWYAKNS